MKRRHCVWLSVYFLLVLNLLFLIATQQVFSDAYLTKGACEGELYIYGRYEGEDNSRLYRSTDHGETITIQDSTYAIGYITAGVDSGEIYVAGVGNYLYYGSDHGVTFTQKGPWTSYPRASGNAPGEIYAYQDGTVRYSTDYGESFVIQSSFGINIGDMCVGTAPGELYIGDFYGEIYHSADYGVTFDTTGYLPGGLSYLTKGTISGELFVLKFEYGYGRLYYSSSFGDSLSEMYYFAKPETVDSWYIQGIAGGSDPGEIYVHEDIPHFEGGAEIYMNYSPDYGSTFTRYHPFSTTQDVLPPQAITDLTCDRLNDSSFLGWSPIIKDIWNRPETVDYYVVYRDTLNQFDPVPGDSIGASTVSEYLDLDALANPGQQFCYVVKAVDDSGNKSESSNVVGMFEKDLVNDNCFLTIYGTVNSLPMNWGR